MLLLKKAAGTRVCLLFGVFLNVNFNSFSLQELEYNFRRLCENFAFTLYVCVVCGFFFLIILHA